MENNLAMAKEGGQREPKDGKEGLAGMPEDSMAIKTDRLPVMTFLKDAQTGKYVMCSQSFASFVQKNAQQDVEGLTDFDIFSHEDALRFEKDDKKAMMTDGPYEYLEETRGFDGVLRRFRIVKGRHADVNGNKMLFGIVFDVTDDPNAVKGKKEDKRPSNPAGIYESICDALSEEYLGLFYVDLATDEYMQYGASRSKESVALRTHGKDFFGIKKKKTWDLLHKDGQEGYIEALDKEKILHGLQEQGTYAHPYRRMVNGEMKYVQMRTRSIPGDDRHMVATIANIDQQMKDRMLAGRIKEERKTFLLINALNGNLLAMYIVDLSNDSFTEYSAVSDYAGLGIEKQGMDFFGKSIENSKATLHSEDLPRFQAMFSKENILSSIASNGAFSMDYRLVVDEVPIYVRLKAAVMEEEDKRQLIIGVFNVDAQVRSEQEYAYNLHVAQDLASKDSLTGVNNKHAYVEAERQLDEWIERGERPEFAIVICDINGLKAVNDTMGHREGDRLILRACAIISVVFQNSQVYRIGGDEFAVIVQGEDYAHIDELMERMEIGNIRHKQTGGVVIACGLALFETDRSVSTVFERADRRMYHHKAMLKAL